MKTSTQEHAQPGSELTLGNVGQILTVFTVEKFPNAKRGISEVECTTGKNSACEGFGQKRFR